MCNKRQVFFNSDANGITLLSVAVYSLLKTTNPSIPITIFIAHDSSFIASGCIGRISNIVSKFPFATVLFGNLEPILRANDNVFADLQDKFMMWGFPFCDKLIPPEMSGNIVYIDLDMVVMQDLAELYDMDLKSEGLIAAAVNESARENLPHLLAAEWPDSAGIAFNNATCVVNLDAFRAEHISDKILSWKSKYLDKHYTDQDAQNVVYGARTRRIPMKWNYTDGWLERIIKLNPFAQKWRVFPPREVLGAILHPCIIHYIGPRKPDVYNHRPERKVFRKLMCELGLIENNTLRGETTYNKVVALFFDGYHFMLKLYARMLFAIRRT